MPRVVDHAARRSEIVLGLWQVIHEKGLDGVSFRAVAEAAGVSIGRIQHYFRSKDELIQEGCARIVSAAQTQFSAFAADAGPGRTLWHLVATPIPRTRPERFGAAIWYAYLAKSTSDPALQEIIATAVDSARAEAVRLLGAARDDARSGGAVDREALRLLALGDGLAQRVVVGALDGDEAIAILADEFAGLGFDTSESRS